MILVVIYAVPLFVPNGILGWHKHYKTQVRENKKFQVKPLLEVTNNEALLAAKESELHELREVLQRKEDDLNDITERVEQVLWVVVLFFSR